MDDILWSPMSSSSRSCGCQRLNAVLTAAIVLSMATLTNGATLSPVQGFSVSLLEAIPTGDTLYECPNDSIEWTLKQSTTSYGHVPGQVVDSPVMNVERPTMPGRGNLPPPSC